MAHRVSKFKVLRKTWPRIYALPTCLMVDARLKRRGQRFYCKTLDAAKVKAEALANERINNGVESLEFPSELRVMAAHASKRLEPWGKTIAQAADFYVKFLEGERARHDSLLFQDVVDQYLAQRERDCERGSLAPRSLREIKMRMNQLRAAFNGAHVGEVDAKRMREFIEGQPVAPKTRVNLRLYASGLFNFARDQGFIETNPVERLRYRVPESEVQILTVERAERLLRAVEASGHGDLVAFVALGLFGFMRVWEVRGLRWECVTDETIEVKAKTSKVRRRRFIEIGETLASWMSTVRRESGPVCEPNFRRRWERATKGIELSANVLRHSAISYGLAFHADEAWVARQAGTSVSVIKVSYESALPRSEAERFLGLRP